MIQMTLIMIGENLLAQLENETLKRNRGAKIERGA